MTGVNQDNFTCGPVSDASYYGETFAISVVGLVYLMVFLPLTLWSAAANNLDFIDLLFVVHLAEALAGLGRLEQVYAIFDASDPSSLFALGVFCGAMTLNLCLMRVSLKKNGLLKVLIMSSGLMGGYILTILFNHYFITPLSSNLLFPATLTFGYVFLLYYILQSLLERSSKWGIKAKYEHFFDGLQSFGSAWILSRLFGEHAVIFLGITFYISTFIAACFFELTVGFLIKRVFTVVPEIRAESFIATTLTLIRAKDRDFFFSFYTTIIVSFVFFFLVVGAGYLILKDIGAWLTP